MKKSELKKVLLNATGCGLQHAGWPCGTCFFSISKKLTNKDWQAVLLFRGDNKKENLKNLPANIEASLEKTLKLARAVIGK